MTIHNCSKLNFRDFAFGGVFDFEELAFGEVEHSRDDIRREHLDLVVVEQYLVVIPLPGERDMNFEGRNVIFSGMEFMSFVSGGSM